ncbi:MAG: glycosyltransferase [Candidatus Polarisedimenticolia bacterium]
MMPRLDDYAALAGPEVTRQLRALARPLEGRTVVHVNSTRTGGGVAEILMRLVPLMQELGIRASWEVIEGNKDFFDVTKGFHNALQGKPVNLSSRQLAVYQEVNEANAAKLRDRLEDADFVFVHDPQPAALMGHMPRRRGRWLWRCHIDVSQPHRPVWRFLRGYVEPYDASIYSIAPFAQPLNHPQYIIPPSIDPLSIKNEDLAAAVIDEVFERFLVDRGRPILLQVSRFDQFKDPVGVIRAFRIVRRQVSAQLVLAGGTADDDPEGEAVLALVREEAAGDPDIHILLLPPDAHRDINALQRGADIVLQKSLREGFGLTVTEALWKGKPVIGGETGGIVLQVVNGLTGYRVNTPEGAAFRILHMLSRPALRAAMGERGRLLVRENFLLTRHLRDYLTLMLAFEHGSAERVVLE